MSKAIVVGWIIELVGMALWLYGYFATGHPSIIDWQASTPWWIADCLPNVEAEIGMVLVFAGMVPLYWPSQQKPIPRR
jgi:protein-S-isoprenylcysteine O-methyltransferase Ste14